MRRVLLTFLALWASGVGLLAGAEAAKEPIITMSPFEVGANSVDFKSWIKVSSPHYLLYTDAKEKEANQALVEMEKLHAAAEGFFGRRATNRAPIRVVLPTSRSDWRKLESKGGVEWEVTVSQPASLLVDLVLVQYDWQEEGLLTLRAAQGPAVIKAMNLKGDFWFEEGVGSFFETVEFDGNKVILGRMNQRMGYLLQARWIDWGKFFRLDGNSREYTKEDTVHAVVGQSAAFVHYMLSNPDPVWRARLLDWNARLEAGVEPTEAEFKAIFGQDWKTWQKTMEEYLQNGKYQRSQVSLSKDALAFPTSKVDLSLSEMRELFVLSQILNQDVPASVTALNAILQRGLKNESLRELLVEACLRRNRPEAAFEQIKLMIAANSPNPLVYVMEGHRIFAEHVPEISIRSRLSAETAGDLRALYRKALAIEPLNVEALRFLAWVEALGPEVSAGNLAAIERIYRTLDGYAATSDAVAAMATATWRAGDKPWAAKIAQALDASPYTDSDGKRIASELRRELSGIAVPSPAPRVKPGTGFGP